MSETARYHLYLTDDSNTKFLEWGEKINGTNDSNMVIIDTALGEKADSSITVEGVLLTEGWVGDTAPYTQEIAVDGLGAEQNGTIAVSHSATSEQRSEAREAIMSVTSQEDGKLIVSSDGKLPVIDIPITVVLLG